MEQLEVKEARNVIHWEADSRKRGQLPLDSNQGRFIPELSKRKPYKAVSSRRPVQSGPL